MTLQIVIIVCLFAHSVCSQQPRPPSNISHEESVHESEIVFSVLYSLTLVASLVLFYYERKIIKPVIIDHAARANHLDFSAVQLFSGKFDINERIHLSLPPKEKVLWGDVSLVISPISHLVMVIVNLAFGYLLIIVTHQLELVPLLLLVLFLGFAYVANGMRQVIGKRHFKNVYALSENRLVVINFSHLNCRKPAAECISYQDIADVQLFIRSGDEVGSISFRKKTVAQGSIFGKGHFKSFFNFMDDSYRELLNIVNPREVEKLLLRNISASSAVEGFSEIGYQEL